MHFFGETSRSRNGAVATVNGLLWSVDRRFTLALYQRSLPRHYQALYAAPLAEGNGAANERGIYLGGNVRFKRSWILDAYTDVWRHPWLRFGVNAPSAGNEHLLRIQWMYKKTFSTYVLFQNTVKQAEVETHGVADQIFTRWRLHAVYRVSRTVEWRSRLEWTRFRVENQAAAGGFLVFQEAVVKPVGFPLSGSVRYTLFDTEAYESRIYAFENDVFAAVSVPGFAGQGARYFINLRWKASKLLSLEARWEETLQRRVVTQGGAPGKERWWKIQAVLRW
jgi:hypothetical protein